MLVPARRRHTAASLPAPPGSLEFIEHEHSNVHSKALYRYTTYLERLFDDFPIYPSDSIGQTSMKYALGICGAFPKNTHKGHIYGWAFFTVVPAVCRFKKFSFDLW